MKDKLLEITDSYIRFSGTTQYVMMKWEHPIMKKHAEVVCKNSGDILEIGFGMGISANYIQQHNIKSHTIVEIYPDIIAIAKEWSKNKPNVTILEGDWYELQFKKN